MKVNLKEMTDAELEAEYEDRAYNAQLASQFNEGSIELDDYAGEVTEEIMRRHPERFSE